MGPTTNKQIIRCGQKNTERAEQNHGVRRKVITASSPPPSPRLGRPTKIIRIPRRHDFDF